MITAKVIDVQKGDGDTAQVCLRIERDEEGNDFVKITAWHFDEDVNPYLQETQMKFTRDNFDLCAEYIENFSGTMAQNFVDRFEI